MKTLNHNVRRWLITAALCIGAIILLSVIFRGCVYINPHKSEKKGVEQANKALQKAYDSLVNVTEASKSREDSLQQITKRQSEQLKVANFEIANSRRKILVIAAALDSAKVNRDTAQFMALADSLKLESVAQQTKIEFQKQRVDSTIQNYEQRLAAKDKQLEAQAELIGKLRTSYLDLNDKYNSLHVDYGKVARKLRGERTLGRGLALGAAALAVLVISK